MNQENETIEQEERLHKKFTREYKKRKENVENGGVNCIPSPLKRFRVHFPGIEKKRNIIVTANSKVGKTQIADYLFVLSPILYAYHNRDKIRLKILYFSLEMSIQEKLGQWTCWWLYNYTKGRIRIDTKILTSVNEEMPLPDEVLELLDSEEYNDFFNFIEDTVVFNETDRNPYGIYKESLNFALANGDVKKKWVNFKAKVDIINPNTGQLETTFVDKQKQVIDRYVPHDPELYVLKVVDHVGLYGTEKGMDIRQTIGKASSQDNVILRNIYGFTNIDIQQQASDKESNEAFKLDRLTPSPDGLGENKTTQRDCNVMLGLFSPWRHAKGSWEGYNVVDFKDNIRFLEICLNRHGSSGQVCPLYFDGAVNFFAELPLPNDVAGLEFYKQMAQRAQLN